MTQPQAPEWTGEHNRFAFAPSLRPGSLRWVISGVLWLALAAEVARTSTALWALAGTKPGPTRSLRPAPTPSGEPSVRTLMAAHLFGQARSPSELPASASAAGARWVLSGTLQGKTPGAGAAILGRTATSTHFCNVGQEVSDGFTLAEVFLDHVTIQRAGERLTLELPRMLLGGQYSNPDVRLASAESRRPVPRRVPPQLTDRAANRPPAYVELRPFLHRGNGGFDGMRIWGTGDGRNLGSYGLERNDIIHEVDGQAINNFETQRRALDALSQGHPVTVTVERNGNLFTLQLGFSENDG